MKCYYKYNGGKIYSSYPRKKSFSNLIKSSLTRKGYDINKFIDENNGKLEKCRICKSHYPPVTIDCYYDNGEIIVTGFKYIKDKIYCYGLNKECPGIAMNSNSVEFISKTLLLTNEEALKYIKENNNSCFYKENWTNDEEYKQYQKRDIDFFKKKYNTDWEIEYDKYKRKISYSNSKDGYIEKYGEQEGLKLFNLVSSKKDSMSYNFFLKKNNNDYEKTKYEYEKRIESVLVNLDFCIKKYGEVKGNEYYIDLEKRKKESSIRYRKSLSSDERKNKYGISIEKFYKKYNDLEKSESLYFEWLKKVTVPICRASKESMSIFKEVIAYLKETGIDEKDIYVGHYDKNEYFIKDKSNIFFYDFTIRSKKIIIEYNGVAFHPKNENIETFKPINTKLSAIDLYNKQKYKVELAESKGFKVLEIWSDEINNYEKCIDFIKNNIDNGIK